MARTDKCRRALSTYFDVGALDDLKDLSPGSLPFCGAFPAVFVSERFHPLSPHSSGLRESLLFVWS